MSHKNRKNNTEKESTNESQNISSSAVCFQKIHPKDITMMFENQLPPHSDEERQQLEKNILNDGGIRNPLIIWKKGKTYILIDGLLRHWIALKLNLICPVIYKEFNSVEEAKAFVLSEQLGRRNLSKYWYCELVLQLEEYYKNLGRINQSKGGEGCPIADKERIDTKKILAEKAGVSHDTLLKAKTILKEVKEPAIIDGLRSGKRSISSVYDQITGKQKKSEPIQKQLFDNTGNLIHDFTSLKSMTIIPNNDGSFKIEVLTRDNEKQVYETKNQIIVTETIPNPVSNDAKILHTLYDEYNFNTVSNIPWEDLRTMFIQDVRNLYKYVSLNMDEKSEYRFYIEKLRLELLQNWEQKNQPLGGCRKSEVKIIGDLKKFKDIDTSTIFIQDDSGIHDVLKTWSRLTAGLNQYFPEMMDTPTQSGTSPMDVIKDSLTFLKFMERCIVSDGLHYFNKSLEYKSNNLKAA